VFVTLPALLPVLLSRQFLFGFTTILANVAILVLTYVVWGSGWSSSCGGGRSAVRSAGRFCDRASAGRAAAVVLLAGLVLHHRDLAGVHGDLLGGLLVTAEVRGAWLLQPAMVIWDVAWFGERVPVTAALLRVATGVAGFTGLYYAVTILVDSAYRDQFVDTLSAQLRGTFERRSEYLDLPRRRGVAVAPGDPT
jgi:hypothetical protein